jgi:hypothetical protein
VCGVKKYVQNFRWEISLNKDVGVDSKIIFKPILDVGWRGLDLSISMLRNIF